MTALRATAEGAGTMDGPGTFTDAIGAYASGVALITCPGEPHASVEPAVTVARLSVSPPRVLVCVAADSPLAEAERFAVNVLSEDQLELSERPTHTPTVVADTGVPVVTDAIATIDCAVADRFTTNGHLVVIGEVLRVTTREGEPLTVFGGAYESLALLDDLAAVPQLKRKLLRGDLVAGELIDVPTLVASTGLSGGVLINALTRLADQGFVARERGGGFRAHAPSLENTIDVVRAREAIELGAVALAMERVTEDEVAEARLLLSALRTTSMNGAPILAVEWVPARKRFLEFIVGLSGSNELIEAYRRLNAQAVVSRLHIATLRSQSIDRSSDLAHRRLVVALERRDLPGAAAAVHAHTELTLGRLRQLF